MRLFYWFITESWGMKKKKHSKDYVIASAFMARGNPFPFLFIYALQEYGSPRSRLPARSVLLPAAEVSTGHPHRFAPRDDTVFANIESSHKNP